MRFFCRPASGTTRSFFSSTRQLAAPAPRSAQKTGKASPGDPSPTPPTTITTTNEKERKKKRHKPRHPTVVMFAVCVQEGEGVRTAGARDAAKSDGVRWGGVGLRKRLCESMPLHLSAVIRAMCKDMRAACARRSR